MPFVEYLVRPHMVDLGVTPNYFSHLTGKKSRSLGLTSVPLEIAKALLKLTYNRPIVQGIF